MSKAEWEQVHERLLDNARAMSEKHREEIMAWGPVLAAGEYFLPAYAPYVGQEYFTPRTEGRRILAYALSQNLSETDGCAVQWARDWQSGLDRQNIAYRDPKQRHAAMNPFDTGHIPILASLLRAMVTYPEPPPIESIYPEIAATNLSKFSFRSQGQTTDNSESLGCCWSWFSRLEVELLRPDYIICCDPRTYRVVTDGLSDLSPTKGAPASLLVSFPSLRVINRHYRNDGLRRKHVDAGSLERSVTPGDLRRLVQFGDRKTVQEVIARDRYYFAEMRSRMHQQVRARKGAPEIRDNGTNRKGGRRHE